MRARRIISILAIIVATGLIVSACRGETEVTPSPTDTSTITPTTAPTSTPSPGIAVTDEGVPIEVEEFFQNPPQIESPFPRDSFGDLGIPLIEMNIPETELGSLNMELDYDLSFVNASPITTPPVTLEVPSSSQTPSAVEIALIDAFLTNPANYYGQEFALAGRVSDVANYGHGLTVFIYTYPQTSKGMVMLTLGAGVSAPQTGDYVQVQARGLGTQTIPIFPNPLPLVQASEITVISAEQFASLFS
ncbi:MAG: hypothetical protein J7L90_03880 [Dehalococcoidia bacterium]|nr:hypothetical protein [Dehalococcoidia bacterium]